MNRISRRRFIAAGAVTAAAGVAGGAYWWRSKRDRHAGHDQHAAPAAAEAGAFEVGHLASNAQGLLPSDLGWKDTVLVWPGETVRIALDFTHPFHGDQVYMLHCHNLEHEDQGMMLNFKVAS